MGLKRSYNGLESRCLGESGMERGLTLVEFDVFVSELALAVVQLPGARGKESWRVRASVRCSRIHGALWVGVRVRVRAG